jgi:peptidyl-dipeptidase A
MFSALRNIAFAPFALVVEKWRWSVYSGKIKPEEYNSEWWRLRCKYQGIVPPVSRSSNDFDPGAKYVL